MTVKVERRIRVRYCGLWRQQGLTTVQDSQIDLDLSMEDARCLMRRIHDILTTVGDGENDAAVPPE